MIYDEIKLKTQLLSVNKFNGFLVKLTLIKKKSKKNQRFSINQIQNTRILREYRQPRVHIPSTYDTEKSPATAVCEHAKLMVHARK